MVWREKRKIMKSYDVTSEMYDERYTEEQQRKFKKALEKVNVASLTVLDVGCGSGLFFNQVTDKAGITVGVDISNKLLLKAKERANAFQNAFILQADADHLPFRDDLFEAVFAFTVLQNMPKPTETLRELKRVCKKDGRLAVTGLKKAFLLKKFLDVLEDSGLKTVAFVDEDAINCYVAVLTV